MHGASFVRLASELRGADSDTILARLLEYHRAVQRDRRRGEAWICDRDEHLLLLTSYTARPARSRFPSYKLDVLRQLLIDTGRLPEPASAEEVA